MQRTYHGGCHCGAVTYAVSLDLEQGTMKCNCSICRSMRAWIVMARAEDFTLLSGKDSLGDYQFGTRMVHHYFCRECGIHSFGQGDVPEAGGRFYSIFINCLKDLDDRTLATLPVTYCDGRHDDWQSPPAETRHL